MGSFEGNSVSESEKQKESPGLIQAQSVAVGGVPSGEKGRGLTGVPDGRHMHPVVWAVGAQERKPSCLCPWLWPRSLGACNRPSHRAVTLTFYGSLVWASNRKPFFKGEKMSETANEILGSSVFWKVAYKVFYSFVFWIWYSPFSQRKLTLVPYRWAVL